METKKHVYISNIPLYETEALKLCQSHQSFKRWKKERRTEAAWVMKVLLLASGGWFIFLPFFFCDAFAATRVNETNPPCRAQARTHSYMVQTLNPLLLIPFHWCIFESKYVSFLSQSPHWPRNNFNAHLCTGFFFFFFYAKGFQFGGSLKKITPPSLALVVAVAAAVCRIWWIKSTSAAMAPVCDQRLKHRRAALDTAAPSISAFAAQQQSIVKRKHSACAKASKWYMSPNDLPIKGWNSRQARDATPLNNGGSVALHRDLWKLVFWPFFFFLPSCIAMGLASTNMKTQQRHKKRTNCHLSDLFFFLPIADYHWQR